MTDSFHNKVCYVTHNYFNKESLILSRFYLIYVVISCQVLCISDLTCHHTTLGDLVHKNVHIYLKKNIALRSLFKFSTKADIKIGSKMQFIFRKMFGKKLLTSKNAVQNMSKLKIFVQNYLPPTKNRVIISHTFQIKKNISKATLET